MTKKKSAPKQTEDFALRRKFLDIYNEWYIREVGFAPSLPRMVKAVNPLIYKIAQMWRVRLKDDLLECETQDDEKKILDAWSNILNNRDLLPDYYKTKFLNLINLDYVLAEILDKYKQIKKNGYKNPSNNISKGYDKSSSNKRELLESHYRAILAAISTKGRDVANIAYTVYDIQMAEEWQRNTNSPIISEN